MRVTQKNLWMDLLMIMGVATYGAHTAGDDLHEWFGLLIAALMVVT